MNAPHRFPLPNASTDLSDQVALVTGATAGLGRRFAAVLAAAGDGAALYSVTKAAVNRMTEALAVEWVRYGINVNAIAPGASMTEMMEGPDRAPSATSQTTRLAGASVIRPNSTAQCCTWPHRHRTSSPEASSKSTTGNSPAEA